VPGENRYRFPVSGHGRLALSPAMLGAILCIEPDIQENCTDGGSTLCIQGVQLLHGWDRKKRISHFGPRRSVGDFGKLLASIELPCTELLARNATR